MGYPLCVQAIVLIAQEQCRLRLKNRPHPPIIQRGNASADVGRRRDGYDIIPAMERPPSPGIKVCELDAEGYCSGCLRTGAEIGRWMAMSPAQQWQLIAELAQRRQVRQPRP